MLIRSTDTYSTLTEYRELQARAYLQRRAPQDRAAFWARKAADAADAASITVQGLLHAA